MALTKLKEKLNCFPVLFLTISTIWLRLVNLGYSDYQGDEIKALFRPVAGQSFLDFILAQRKGPGQFIVTYLTKFLDPSYFNQFLHRLPFAIAGILAVFFFYKLVKLHFGKKIALYASILMSFNGLFIAFSRIVQYQSFAIMFFVLALYLFSLTIKSEAWKLKGWYLGMVAWGLSMLFHYDGAFILPFVLYILWVWWNKYDLTLFEKLKHLSFASAIGALIIMSFYIPFVLNIDDATKAYWTNRLSGGDDKVSNSMVTFKMYNPKYIFYIFTALVGVSLLKVKKNWMVLLWAVVPFAFMEILTNVPGTHIYTYILPGAILAAFGIKKIEEIIKIKQVSYLGLAVFFVFYLLLSNAIFVDHKVEYPWENEKFLVWNINKPNAVYHLSIFGFPYYRHWEEVADYIFSNEPGEYYSTNERKSIPRFYVPLAKDTDNAGFYVYIPKPQSFANTPYQEKAAYYIDRHDPEIVFETDEKVVTELYRLPVGGLDEIKALGY